MSTSFSRRLASGRRQRRTRRRASAFTLVEMLVAMAVTLILIGALSQAFAIVGESVAQGRAAIELSGSMRSVANQLQEDLDCVTVPVRPWIDDGAGLGYFEIMEGVGHDMNPFPALPMTPTVVAQRTVPDMYGDIDDILAFTARSKQDLFVGVQAVLVSTTPVIWNYVTQQSPIAEIVYFTRFEDLDGDGIPGRGEVTLHRRVFLVLPNLGTVLTGIASGNALATLMEYQSRSDISVHLRQNTSGTYDIVANSLGDLTRRENRYAHWPTAFPFPQRRAMLLPRGAAWSSAPETAGQPGWPNSDDDLNGTVDDLTELGWFASDDRLDYTTLGVGIGEDVALAELLAFDVQVFDPKARVKFLNDEALIPSDPGWWDSTATGLGYGAFVNLNYFGDLYQLGQPSRQSDFSGVPSFRDTNGNVTYDVGERYLGVPFLATLGVGYCTWSMHYERNGVNEDGDTLTDEGTDGFDTDNQNGVDDVGERETSPPYPVPLRGIQVKIRALEPDTRQIRQVTVVSDFIPE